MADKKAKEEKDRMLQAISKQAMKGEVSLCFPAAPHDRNAVRTRARMPRERGATLQLPTASKPTSCRLRHRCAPRCNRALCPSSSC